MGPGFFSLGGVDVPCPTGTQFSTINCGCTVLNTSKYGFGLTLNVLVTATSAWAPTSLGVKLQDAGSGNMKHPV
nr:hypothetical protein BaRGS_016003 [Batillaria attramentaria]